MDDIKYNLDWNDILHNFMGNQIGKLANPQTSSLANVTSQYYIGKQFLYALFQGWNSDSYLVSRYESNVCYWVYGNDRY